MSSSMTIKIEFKAKESKRINDKMRSKYMSISLLQELISYKSILIEGGIATRRRSKEEELQLEGGG